MTIWNYAAGPAKLPHEVLIRAKSELTNWQGSGMSVMEMSHRSKHFESIIAAARNNIRKLLKVPDNYKILFMQGGGSGQFACVPLNLCKENAPVDYLVTGAWSQKAAEEAQKLEKNVNIVVDTSSTNHSNLPQKDQWNLSKDAAYVYYCANETIHGVEFHSTPEVDGVLVCDMSSNFLSRPVDVSKFGLIFAGAQKNFGPAGVTVVIVREDLLGKAVRPPPSVMDYQITADNKSMYNTPPTFAIYIVQLVTEWIIEQGGLEKMEELARARAQLLYDCIEGSNGFFTCPVDRECRSRMNIPFRIYGGSEEGAQLEEQLLSEASRQGLVELKGHRSVGGLRASLYNAMPVDGAQHLVDFMKAFMERKLNPTAAQVPIAQTAATAAVDVVKHSAVTVPLEEKRVLIADKCDDVAIKLLVEAGVCADVRTGLSENELVAIVGDYDAMVVRSATTVTPNIIKAAKKMQIIGRAGVGVDNIHIPTATECGVLVVNSPQGNTTSAAEHTWGMILAAARMIPQAHGKLKDKGEWDRKFIGVEMEGRVLGILGLGNVGKKVARYGIAFGMKVLAYDPFVSQEVANKLGVTMLPLEQVLTDADVISLHLPSIKETRHIINAQSIKTMKKGCILVNVARGECVDEAALAAALQSGHVLTAALDVFHPEPLHKDSPLLKCDNIVVTPHLGANTKEAQVRVAVDVVQQIIEVFKGRPAQAAVNGAALKAAAVPVKA